jgi:predicted transcriptional regulator
MREMTIQTRDQSPEAILQRIDTIMRELGELRQMVLRIQSEPAAGNLAQQLYGVLGQGTWEEYDMQLDW